jgi:hypothetical protein
MVESIRHQELTHWQARDSKRRFSLGRTRTPPLGSPSSGFDDESALEMWYVAPMPTRQ